MARVLMVLVTLVLGGCGPGLEFNASPEMTPEQMLGRASHVFIGVIEKHELESWPFMRTPDENSPYWKVMRRRLRLETVLRGEERRPVVYFDEIYWTGGAAGNWNSTVNGQRYLVMLRVENGRYHVVRDWWHSLFEVSGGRLPRLPLGDSSPFWERFALMMLARPADWMPAMAYAAEDSGQVLTF